MSRKTANRMMWGTIVVLLALAGVYAATVYDTTLKVAYLTGDWMRTLGGGEWKSSPSNMVDTFTGPDTFKTGWFYWNSNTMFVNGTIKSKGAGKDSVNFYGKLEGSYDNFVTISYSDTFAYKDSFITATVTDTFKDMPPGMKWRFTGIWRYADSSGAVILYGWAPENSWITF